MSHLVVPPEDSVLQIVQRLALSHQGARDQLISLSIDISPCRDSARCAEESTGLPRQDARPVVVGLPQWSGSPHPTGFPALDDVLGRDTVLNRFLPHD